MAQSNDGNQPENTLSAGDEPALADRVLGELKLSGDMYGSKRDRLPPAWQIIGAIALLIALSSVVISAGNPGADWHERFLTGFMDGVLVFLGDLGGGLRQFWDTAFPGKGSHVMIGVTIGVTITNLGLLGMSIRRHRQRSST